jgi:hypothetical protein
MFDDQLMSIANASPPSVRQRPVFIRHKLPTRLTYRYNFLPGHGLPRYWKLQKTKLSNNLVKVFTETNDYNRKHLEQHV